MVFGDEAAAARPLMQINYYRLRAYWLPFEDAAPAPGEHAFKPGTRFEDVIGFYEFDRRLRLLVMGAVERVEVSVRARWAHVMALAYGAHGYLVADHFSDPIIHAECLDKLNEEIRRSKETFVKHYKAKYTNPQLPPLWAVCEVMSLGHLSRWVGNLKFRKDRREIASTYQVDPDILESFLHHLTVLRNTCAHHSRLWNRRFGLRMKVPKHPNWLAACFGTDPGMLYNTLVMLAHMQSVIANDSMWAAEIVALLDEFPQAKPKAMGFPDNWRTLPLWSDAT